MTLLLAVNDFPPIPGGESTLYYGVAGRLPHGHGVILAPRGPGHSELDSRLAVEVVRHWLPPARGQAARVARGLLTGLAMARLLVIRQIRYLVCGQLLSIGIPGRLLAGCARIPYALVIHGADLSDYHDRRPWRRLLRWTVRGADVVFVNSRFTAGLVERLLPGAARRIEVLPMGVAPVVEVDPGRIVSWRRRYALGEGPVLITVARLVAMKGHDTVLEALGRVRKRVPEVRYLVVGDGPERGPLEDRTRALGLDRHVVFAGAVAAADLPAHYRLATLFVQLSRDRGPGHGVEGFGLSFLEAASYGLPCVAGRSGGTPEAVVDGRTGFLVSPEDPEAVAGAIERLLGDPDERLRLSQAARLWAETHTWDDAAARLLAAAGRS